MAIEPFGKIMLGTILRYDYEVRDEKELSRGVATPKIPKEMVSLASHILDTKAGHFDPSQFKDEFEMELRKLVKRKAAGKTIETPEREERPSNVVDLMEALRQSVDGRGKRAAALRSSSSNRKTAKPKSRKTSTRARKASGRHDGAMRAEATRSRSAASANLHDSRATGERHVSCSPTPTAPAHGSCRPHPP